MPFYKKTNIWVKILKILRQYRHIFKLLLIKDHQHTYKQTECSKACISNYRILDCLNFVDVTKKLKLKHSIYLLKSFEQLRKKYLNIIPVIFYATVRYKVCKRNITKSYNINI